MNNIIIPEAVKCEVRRQCQHVVIEPQIPDKIKVGKELLGQLSKPVAGQVKALKALLQTPKGTRLQKLKVTPGQVQPANPESGGRRFLAPEGAGLDGAQRVASQ